MAYSTTTNESETRQRLEAFWAGESLGRPCLHVHAKNPDYVATPWREPQKSLMELDLDPAFHAWQIEEWTRSRVWLGESMPCHQLLWGSALVTLAVLAGGDYEYHDSAWITEVPDLYVRPLPEFSAAHPVAQKMEKCYGVDHAAAHVRCSYHNVHDARTRTACSRHD
jgi:hypothetical protein